MVILDSRQINPDIVIELISQKINTNNFVCRLHAYNTDEINYEFWISAKYFEYDFSYKYEPKLRIREMNKLLKRKNNNQGISTEQLVADDMYQKFMSDWIGMAKINHQK